MSLFEAPNNLAVEIHLASFSIPWRVRHPFTSVIRSIPSQRRKNFPITKAPDWVVTGFREYLRETCFNTDGVMQTKVTHIRRLFFYLDASDLPAESFLRENANVLFDFVSGLWIENWVGYASHYGRLHLESPSSTQSSLNSCASYAGFMVSWNTPGSKVFSDDINERIPVLMDSLQ